MTRSVVLALAWGSVGLACAGFFQPWVRIDVRDPGLAKPMKSLALAGEGIPGLTKGAGRITVTIRRGTKTVTGDLASLGTIPHQISGVQVPQVANQENAQLTLSIMELLMNERQHIGLKSYAVYLLPGIALLCAGLLTAFGGRPPVAWGVAGLCALIAGVGGWKLLTTNLHARIVAVSVAHGLWMSLWAYVGIAAAGVLAALSAKDARA